MNHLAYQRRCGYTIIEMLVVVGVLSMLLSLVTMSLTTLLQVGQSSADRINWQATWHRLALDFAADAHAAGEAALTGDGAASLQLASENGTTVLYQFTNTAVARTVQRNDAVVASELYRLPQETQATLLLNAEPHGVIAAISLARPNNNEDARGVFATQLLRIEAYVGLDHRPVCCFVAGGPAMKRYPPTKRSAMVLMMLIFAFAAASVLAVAMARMFVLRRQVQTNQEKHLQAVLLAEAGVERAAARLSDDPQFAGDTWTVSPDQLDLREAASVQITVAVDDAAPTGRIVKSIATLGDVTGEAAAVSIKHRREARLTVASP